MITCFGTITNDIIEFEGRKEKCLGGAPFFFNNVCKDLDASFSIVSTIGREELEKNKNLDSKGLQVIDKITELHIKEADDVTCSVSNFGKLDIKKVPKRLFESEIIMISPLFSEVDPSMFRGSFIALDIQGFMRDVNSKTLSENKKKVPKNLNRLLSNVGILKCNENESKIVFGNVSIEQRLRKFAEMGPSIVIITLGENGVALIHRNKFLFLPAKMVENVNTVGAGDIFFSAFLVKFHKTKNVSKSAKFAVNYTSKILGRRI